MKILKVKHSLLLTGLFIWILFFTSHSFAQKNTTTGYAERPKLIVGIIVDQMRYDYLFRYREKFGKDGFMRLVNEGFFCENTNFNYVPTYTGPGHACVYTGTTPSVNGIIANDWYDRNGNETMYCVKDASVQSLGTVNSAGEMSPKNLLTTTITDELRLSDNFQSKVIGISLKDRGAILPAGHSANAAYWFDPATGSWISSTYYMKELPGWVKEFNAKKLPDHYLSEPWKTLLPIDQYTESTSDDTPYEGTYPDEAKPVFPHDLPKLKRANYDLIPTSPNGNMLTKELALAALKNENMGKGKYTDFLAVSFSATDYVSHQFGTNSIETEDTYLRLDKDIAELLKYIDDTYGKNNVLVFLTADHGAIQNPQYLRDNHIPAGTIDENGMKEYLLSGLKKKYNESGLVSGFFNGQVYLDRSLIKEKKLDLEEVQDAAADMLLDFDGVANTITASQLDEGNCTEGIKALVQRGFNRKRSGDVMVVMKPGLMDYRKTGTSHGSGYNYDTHVPLIWYGWNIKQGSSDIAVTPADIAPTIAAMLHIEPPSGCTGKPIHFSK